MADITRSYLTYSDIVDYLADYAQGQDQGVQQSIMRRCTLRAYDEIVHGFEWPFLKGIDRIHANAAESTGTVTYSHSAKTLTLSDATWPTWATADYGACVYLDDVVSDVVSRTSDTVIVLDSDRNPGADLTDKSFTIFCRWYPLPNDFLATVGPMAETFRNFGSESSYETIASEHRHSPLDGDMTLWAVGPNPNADGGLALHVWPALDSSVRIDMPYKKRPRDLRHSGHASGDFAGTISVSSTAVTGSGTSFNDTMVGSILRVGGSVPPTGLEGQYPYTEELIVASVESTTALTLKSAGTTVSDKSYRISCPVSLERVAWDALLTCAEKHLSRMRSYKGYAQTVQNHMQALRFAKEAASTSSNRRTIRSGTSKTYKTYYRLADLV